METKDEMENKKEEVEEDSFNSQSETEKNDEIIKEAEKSKIEWEEIEKIQKIADELPQEKGVGGVIVDRTSSVTFYDSRIQMKEEGKVIDCHIPLIEAPSSIFCCMNTRIPQISQNVWTDIVRISKVHFSDDNLYHHRILNTIHYLITGISAPPRYGEHWQLIGFQTKDPTTDLRSMGMLALLLPLGILSKYRNLSKKLIETSRMPEQDFPIMLVLINYAKSVFDACHRTHLLTVRVETESEAWDRILNYYAGMIEQTCVIWKRDFLTFTEDFDTFKKIPERAFTRVNETVSLGAASLKSDAESNTDVLTEIQSYTEGLNIMA